MLRCAPHRSRGSRPALRAPARCARSGGRAPRTPSRGFGRYAASLACRGCAPGPGATRAPPGPPGGSQARPQTRYCMRAGRAWRPAPFAHSASPVPPGPLPLRRSAPARRARRRYAGPVRRFRPRFARRARPSALPPGSPARALPAGFALGGLSLAPSAFGPGLAALRAPCSVALAAVGLGPCAARGPAGPPLGRPLRGFGGGWLRPRGPWRPFGPPFPAFGPGASAARPRLRGLAVASVRALCLPWGSPLRPPAPPPRRPRWGLRGARGSPWRGACGPPPRVRFLAALWAAPPGLRSAPGAPFSARLTVLKLSTGVYTHRVGGLFPQLLHSLFHSSPAAAPPLSGCRQGCPLARPGAAFAAARASALTLPGFFCPAGLTFPARWVILFVRGSLAAPSGARPRRSVAREKAPPGFYRVGPFFCSRAR